MNEEQLNHACGLEPNDMPQKLSEVLSTSAGKSLLAELDATRNELSLTRDVAAKHALDCGKARTELEQCKAREVEVRKALILFGIHSSPSSKLEAIYALKRILGDKWLAEGKVKK